jgi:hypothetical protein
MHKQGNISDLPGLMLGTSPFIGAGQFGSKSLDYRRQFFDLVSPLEPEFVSVHAQFCDENDARLNEWIDMIRDAGAKPVASTHSPGSTIPLLDDMGFEAYLAPVNPAGYGMEPDVQSTLKALERTR